MKRLVIIISCLFSFTLYEVQAQEEITLFDEAFNKVKKEKKAAYYSEDQFRQKGEEKLVLVPWNSTDKIIVSFLNGEFVSKEPYQDLEKATSEKVYLGSELDEAPLPNGGWEALKDFTRDWSEQRKKGWNKMGKVSVRFIVTGDGNVTDVVVLKSSNKALNSEAVQLVKKFGEEVGWKPGLVDGKPVKVAIVAPFSFF